MRKRNLFAIAQRRANCNKKKNDDTVSPEDEIKKYTPLKLKIINIRQSYHSYHTSQMKRDLGRENSK